MDYPTAEEEYELMYDEELEMMSDFDENDVQNLAPIASTQKPPIQITQNVLNSPALSQISRDERNCLVTPANIAPANKPLGFASTPFNVDKLSAITEQDDDERHLIISSALGEIQNVGFQRKRRLEDLFGDIYDIEEEDGLAKKHKTEEERDMAAIEKILEARKILQAQLNPLKQTHIDRYEALHKFKQENLSRTIPKYSFLPLAKAEMERIYVRFHSEDLEGRQLMEIKAYDKNCRCLLGSQRDEIWNTANEIVLKGLETSRRPTTLTAIDATLRSDTGSSNLWVEKYRPKNYIDLLSNESINRSLLQWLKLWDKVVFNREVTKKIEKPRELNTFNKKTGRFEQNGGWRKRNKDNLNTDLDANDAPVQKIALLVGKPGLGKTTLAHILAKHAGYVIREMNASDDRTVESFKQVLENGTQMTSVLNKDNRPNCIILDEIDGAPLPSIEFLFRFISGQITEKSRKGGNKKKFLLKRPIIAICNDLYGANLRSLRQIAFIVNFNQIGNSRLVERLMYIAGKERVKSDLTALLALAEKTGNDVRSCLSMLQFFGSMKKPLTLIDVLRSNMGQKDQHKELFNVWSSIFQIQRPKRVIKDSTTEYKQVVGMNDMSAATRMKNILETIHMSGDYEKLIQGVFESYLKQKMPDPNLEGVVEAMEWFCFDDRIQTKINILQNYSMYPYLTYGFVCWHFLFSSVSYPQISYPQKQYEVSQKHSITKLIFHNLKKGIVTQLRGAGDGSEILLDSISLIKLIIAPEIRPVSMHLLTQKEKEDLHHTVSIIADLGLTFVQLQASDGTYVYKVEPDIDYLSGSFTGNQAKQMSYWSKQMIAREVDLERMRRARPKVTSEDGKCYQSFKRTSTASSTNEASSVSKALPNYLQKLVPKAIKPSRPTELVCKDFFGRITTKPYTATQNEGSSSDLLVKSPIWYRFKQGFSNAVRTDMIYSDLL